MLHPEHHQSATSLQGVSKYAREAAEFVNLYSKSRGINRFPALIEALEWLQKRPEVQARGVEDRDSRPGWSSGSRRETKLGNPALEAAVEDDGRSGSEAGAGLVEGRERSDRRDGPRRAAVPVRARDAWKSCNGKADCSSSRPRRTKRSKREWEEHDLAKYVARDLRPGNRHQERIARRRQASIRPNHTLMIGDAPGDYKAAVANNALFFPINPGAEEASWRRLLRRRDRPLLRRHASPANISNKLLDEFDTYLPEQPPWPMKISRHRELPTHDTTSTSSFY